MSKETGYQATGIADEADRQAWRLSSAIQRAGLGWPSHETARLIRKNPELTTVAKLLEHVSMDLARDKCTCGYYDGQVEGCYSAKHNRVIPAHSSWCILSE